MDKEMNWTYVRENYGKLFEDNFKKESEVLDVVNISLSEARKMSEEELLNGIRRLECEMRFLVDNFEVNTKIANKLSKWCMNMIQNLMYCIDTNVKVGGK